MVKQFLKIAGVKTQSEFYKKYPSEEAFFRAHPEARQLVHQKMAYGGMYAYQTGGEPVSSDYPSMTAFKAAHDAWEVSQNIPQVDQDTYQLPVAGANGLPDYLRSQPIVSQASTQTYSPVTQAATQSAPAQNQFALNPYQGVSVYDMLEAQGKAGDLQSRKALAQTLGIANYRGLPQQNAQMMEMIRQNPDVLLSYMGASAPMRATAPVISKKSTSGKSAKKSAFSQSVSQGYQPTQEEMDDFLREEVKRQRLDNPYVVDQVYHAADNYYKTPYGNMHTDDEDLNHPANAYPGSIPFGSESFLEQIPVNQPVPYNFPQEMSAAKKAAIIATAAMAGTAGTLYGVGKGITPTVKAARNAADLSKANLTTDQLIAYAKKFGKDPETWQLLKARGMNDFDIAKALKGTTFKAAASGVPTNVIETTQQLLDKFGKVSDVQAKNLENAKRIVQVLKDKKLPRNEEVLAKLAELVPNPATRMQLLKGIGFPETTSAIAKAQAATSAASKVGKVTKAAGNAASVASKIGKLGQEESLLSKIPLIGRFFEQGGAYANVPQHGRLGTYADGTSGTSNGGQSFAFGGDLFKGFSEGMRDGSLPGLAGSIANMSGAITGPIKNMNDKSGNLKSDLSNYLSGAGSNLDAKAIQDIVNKYQAGGSYNPTSVDYGDTLPEFAMGYDVPTAMYGMGMAYGGPTYSDVTQYNHQENVPAFDWMGNGGTPCYNCGGMYQDGGSPLYSTQGQALRNFMNTVGYGREGNQSMHNMQFPAVGPRRYQEGGMPPEQAMMAQQQGQQQAPPQQQGPDPQQIMQEVAQMLQQGMQPEQIMQQLVQEGVPEQMAQQIIQQVMEQMQGAQQNPGGPEPNGVQEYPQGQAPQQPPMRMGGSYQVGGEYDMSSNDIQKLIAQGYKIEYL